MIRIRFIPEEHFDCPEGERCTCCGFQIAGTAAPRTGDTVLLPHSECPHNEHRVLKVHWNWDALKPGDPMRVDVYIDRDPADDATPPRREGGFDSMTLGEVRDHLRKLQALALETPLPTTIRPSDHPWRAGADWRIPTERPVDSPRQWSVRTIDNDHEDPGLVYLHPGSAIGEEDFDCLGTAEARRLATAILAACDRVDAEASGVTPLNRTQGATT